MATTLVALVVLVAGGGYLYALYRYHQVHKDAVRGLTAESGNGSVNILLIGENCRSCLNGDQASSFGTGQEVAGNRSDVTMILHLDTVTHQAAVLSIPRDTFSPVPGSDQANRIDDALNSGPSELVRTIEDDYGIPINHFVALNFDTFQGVVNALGGIDMYFPDPVKDAYSGLDVPTAGCYHLNGTEALEVVRARHLYYEQDGQWLYDGLGDISRIDRDHEFLKVLASSMKGRLDNPVTVNSIFGSIAPDLLVDKGLGLSEMLSLVLGFHSVNPGSVPTQTLSVFEVPGDFTYEGASGYGSVVFPMAPSDYQLIDHAFGITPPKVAEGTKVTVLNGSGIAGQAAQTAQGLSALGEDVVSVGDVAQDASDPAETIVYYAPGKEADAEAMLPYLDGNVVMGELALPAGTDVEVVTGTYLSVTGPATGSTGTGSDTAGAGLAGGGSATTPSVGADTASAVPATDVTEANPGLPSWDPTACPSGVPVTPLP